MTFTGSNDILALRQALVTLFLREALNNPAPLDAGLFSASLDAILPAIKESPELSD